jgi:hypothetical protein
VDPGRQVEAYVRARSGRDVLGRVRQRDVERVVDVAAERGDRGPRFVQRALGRRGDVRERTLFAGLRDERACLADDEGELLRQPVVEIACDATPLAGGRRRDQLLLPRRDLACGSDGDHQIEAEPEDVGGVDPARIERREQEVVESRCGAERRSERKPTEQLVAGLLGAPHEAERGDDIERERDRDEDELQRVRGQVRRIGIHRPEAVDQRVPPIRGEDRNDAGQHTGERNAADERDPRREARVRHLAVRNRDREGEQQSADQPSTERPPGREVRVELAERGRQRRHEEVRRGQDHERQREREVLQLPAAEEARDDQAGGEDPDEGDRGRDHHVHLDAVVGEAHPAAQRDQHGRKQACDRYPRCCEPRAEWHSSVGYHAERRHAKSGANACAECARVQRTPLGRTRQPPVGTRKPRRAPRPRVRAPRPRPAALAHVDFLEPLLRRIEHEHVTRLDLALAVRHPDVLAVWLLDAEHVDVLLTQLQLGECERQRHRRSSGSRIRDSGHLTEPVKAGTRRATRDLGVAV